MIDDLPVPAPDQSQSPTPTRWIPNRLAEPVLAYDYFKTSVTVATLGGILTLSETVFGERIAPWQMGVTAALVALSGFIALQAKTDIVQIAQGVKPPADSSRLALRLVPGLYGAGLGIFLAFVALSYSSPGLFD